MRNIRTKEITLTAVLTAIVIVLALVPQLGYISITLWVGFTIIHIPILIGAYMGGRKVGGFLGLVFGLTSMFVAFTRPQSFLDPIFTNPVVSVLPRFLIGFFAYDVLHFLRKVFTKSIVIDTLFFGTMTFIHSILVIPLLYIAGVNYWYFDVYGISETLTRQGTLDTIGAVSTHFIGGSSFFGFLITILIVNSLLEIALAIIVGVPVVDRLKVAMNNRN